MQSRGKLGSPYALPAFLRSGEALCGSGAHGRRWNLVKTEPMKHSHQPPTPAHTLPCCSLNFVSQEASLKYQVATLSPHSTVEHESTQKESVTG